MSQAKPPIMPPTLQPPVTGFCPIHPRNRAVGRCRKCQQTFCEVCESRWDKESLCLACLGKVLESQEATPGDRQMQRWEASASLYLALAGWLLYASSLWMFWSILGGKGDKNYAIINVVLFLASFIPALLSLGLAASTLRSRGPSMTAATWALVLSALQIGVTLSLVMLNITHN